MNVSFDPDSESQLPRWFGDYVLLKCLGKGGMGQVFLARSPGLAGIDRLCVIKTLRAQWTNDREYVARFVDEARVVVQLSHRNICPVFDVGQVEQTYYLAMELVHGRDLQALMNRCAQQQVSLPLDLTLSLIGEVLEALDAAHRLRDAETDAPLNLVHRDVSPHNVMVSFDGEVKLIDFGLAHSAMKQERTEPGVVLGKLAYMAPEHARGSAVDRRADIFAVGVMLYELAAGERYWADFSMQQIWQVVGQGMHQPRKLASLPDDVRKIIEKATAAEVVDRFSTGAQMRSAISAAQLARGVLSSSADLRQQMELLFDGEEQVDRRERAALAKLVAPGVGRDVYGSSTRIARAPGGPASSNAASPIPDVDGAPTLTDKRRAMLPPRAPPPAPNRRPEDQAASDALKTLEIAFVREAPVVATVSRAVGSDDDDSDDEATVLTMAAGRRPAVPARSRRGLSAALVAVAVAVVVIGVVFWPADTTPPAARDVVAAQTPPPTPTPTPTPDAPPPMPTPTPTPEAPAPETVVPTPTPQAPPPEAVVPTPTLETPLETVVPAPPKKAPRVKTPTPAPTTTTPPKPWPATWPRLADAKQELLRERCASRPCAKNLMKVPLRSVDTAALQRFQDDATACLAACRAASP